MSSICFVLFTFFTKFRQALFSHATRTALDIPSGSVITVKSDKTIGFSVWESAHFSGWCTNICVSHLMSNWNTLHKFVIFLLYWCQQNNTLGLKIKPVTFVSSVVSPSPILNPRQRLNIRHLLHSLPNSTSLAKKDLYRYQSHDIGLIYTLSSRLPTFSWSSHPTQVAQ